MALKKKWQLKVLTSDALYILEALCKAKRPGMRHRWSYPVHTSCPSPDYFWEATHLCRHFTQNRPTRHKSSEAKIRLFKRKWSTGLWTTLFTLWKEFINRNTNVMNTFIYSIELMCVQLIVLIHLYHCSCEYCVFDEYTDTILISNIMNKELLSIHCWLTTPGSPAAGKLAARKPMVNISYQSSQSGWISNQERELFISGVGQRKWSVIPFCFQALRQGVGLSPSPRRKLNLSDPRVRRFWPGWQVASHSLMFWESLKRNLTPQRLQCFYRFSKHSLKQLLYFSKQLFRT